MINTQMTAYGHQDDTEIQAEARGGCCWIYGEDGSGCRITLHLQRKHAEQIVATLTAFFLLPRACPCCGKADICETDEECPVCHAAVNVPVREAAEKE